MKLSDTQAMILTQAANHPQALAHPPAHLPAGARQKVAQALLRQCLVDAQPRPSAYDAHALWTLDGREVVLRITDAGLRAIGIDPNEGMPGEPDCAGIEGSVPDTAPTGGEDTAPQAQDAPAAEPARAAPTRASLRDAAAAVLAAWDASPAQDATDNPISRALEALRALLAGKPAHAPRDPGAPRKPRAGTKQEVVLALLRRAEGATIAQIMEATGWQQHTVRGFFAGLKRRQGIEVQVLERIRQVGLNKEGARGSYSIYKVMG
jgi:hypothetical protein